jgi:hypothetical protein
MTSLSDNQQHHHDQLRSVIGYYDGTWLDYRCLWLNSVNHAIHFGDRDGSRRSHAESLLKTNHVLAEVAAIGPATGCSMPGAE